MWIPRKFFMTSWLKRKEIRSAYSWFCVMHGHQPEVNVAAPTDSDSAGGFPGDPAAETPSSQCRASRFNPWSGN